jgi:hypothetical protein
LVSQPLTKLDLIGQEGWPWMVVSGREDMADQERLTKKKVAEREKDSNSIKPLFKEIGK